MRSWNKIEKGFFAAFLAWSAIGLVFTLLRITPEGVMHWPLPVWLNGFIRACLQNGDPILILLAFANTHLHAARQWTPKQARRWGLIVLVVSFAVETLGVLTGFPFGEYRYTHRFGYMAGAVPMAIPLAWYVVVTNALFIVRSWRRGFPRVTEAAWAALLCTAYDFVLEPFATTVKGYWIWQTGRVPVQNYLAWFVIGGALVWLFAPAASKLQRGDRRPAVILIATVVIFIAGRLVH